MKYYDNESSSVITEEQLFEIFESLKKENPYEYEYSFPEYLENCMYYNNGSLTKLDEKIQNLERKLCLYSKHDENDNTDLIIEIEQLKKQL